ncbi:hypothetical protein H4P12_06860 [Paracoccus sp. 11-3]|uniref:Uncharacterized protein n=1 Tax=Paracoccus amoyensis TaxID=2760093 RepID=A0A926GDQ4_9RHOB|nr:hypothetical protein [Paracoccus amoyensis]MBC9246437.1 hypothetical protein [Paracoccus amoyensis]
MSSVPVSSSVTTGSRAFDRRVLVGLLLVDALLILIYLITGYMVATGRLASFPDIINIGRDWSIGEILGYAKWLALIAVMLTAHRRSPNLIFLAMAFLFVVVLIDDSMQLHENYNGWTTALGFVDQTQAALREVIFFGALGLIVAGPLLLGWFRAGKPVRRKILPLLILFGAIAACGVGVDFLHTALPDRSISAGLAGAFEDGGEMMFLSAMVGYAVGTFCRSPERAKPESRSS